MYSLGQMVFVDEEGSSRARIVGKRREKDGAECEGPPSAKKPSLTADKGEVDVLDSSTTEQEVRELEWYY